MPQRTAARWRRWIIRSRAGAGGAAEKKPRGRRPHGRRPRSIRCVRAALLRPRRWRRRGARAPLRHELIELGLVLGHAQAAEELVEFALLLLEPPQGFRAVLVEGAVAARARRLPPSAGAAHVGAVPTIDLAMFPATHASAPNDEGQGGQTKRPPDDEAEDHQREPGAFSQLIELCNDRHRQGLVSVGARPRMTRDLIVNVNNIYIGPRRLSRRPGRYLGAAPAPEEGADRPSPRR